MGEREAREREGYLLEVGGEMLEARGPPLLLRVRQLREHLVCGAGSRGQHLHYRYGQACGQVWSVKVPTPEP